MEKDNSLTKQSLKVKSDISKNLKQTKSVGTSPKVSGIDRKFPIGTLNKIRDTTIQSAALRLRTVPRGQRNEACTEFNRTLSREIDALEKEIRRPETDPQIQALRADIVRESIKLGENMSKLLKMTLEKD